MKRLLPVALIAVILLLPALAARGEEDTREMVARFVSSAKGTALGQPATLIQVTPADGGAGMTLALPDPDMADTAAKLKPGDYIFLLYMKSGRDLMVGKIALYDLKPGEDQPNVYFFVKFTLRTIGKKEVATVTVRQFGKEAVLPVPTAKNAEGKIAPKEELMTALQAFKPDDLVEIHTIKGALNSIKPYEAPKPAEFVKAQKGEDGQTTVELKVEGQSQTFTIARKNPALAGKVHSFKAGQAVTFRSETDDKGAWLIEVKAAPKGAKPPDDSPKEEKTSPKKLSKKVADQ